MQEPFDVPVSYKGEEILFPAELQPTGYTYRFLVNVYGVSVIFEPDEERAFRAVVEPEKLNKRITMELLQAIAETLHEVLK